MNFFAVILIFFCSRNDATGKDPPASDLDGMASGLSEEGVGTEKINYLIKFKM